jgi:peptidoglycan lytic transglycosylase B
MRRVAGVMLAVIMSAAAIVIAAQDPAPITPVAPLPPPFTEWLTAFRAEAAERGIRPEILDHAFAGVEPVEQILERDRSQAEFTLNLDSYLRRRLTPSFIRTAQKMYAGRRSLLTKVGEKYGVSPRVVVAVWGLESNFGRFAGVRPTIPTLATLAYDQRRSAMFRNELFSALEILNRGDIEPEHMKGSWAGAMGQTQFMPSSYLQYAEDFDGDGRRDIWSNTGDAIASIANYMKGHGWHADETWGREVRVSAAAAKRIVNEVARRNEGCRAVRDMTVALPMARWEALGVRLPGGKPLPKTDLPASLISGTSRHFLVYRNYHAILEYNCANSYALTVALLGDRIAAGPAPARPKTPARKRR